MKEATSLFLSKTKIFCKSYIELCVWLLVFAIGVRFFETLVLTQINHDFLLSSRVNLIGLGYDILLFLRLNICVLIIFLALSFINEKKTRFILRIMLSLMLLISLILVVFFATSGYLLDKVLFSYSLKEIWEIIITGATSPIWVYIIAVVLPALFYYLSGKRIKINCLIVVLYAVLTVISLLIFRVPEPDIHHYHVKTNKEYFFLKTLFQSQTISFKENDKEIIKTVDEFRSFFPEHQFAETEYPFLYKSDYKDVLSSFFNLNPEPPNLVFIIVEGLGYEYLKNDYQLMPYLDSFSNKSLTWEHCLSVSARTFGVLPALFGASPLGTEGFMYQSPNNPEFHSLLRILHQNGYTNHFFYGGGINFDNMGHFSHQNNMPYLTADDWDEDIKNETLGIRGYEDHLVYLQALRKLNQINCTPRADVYLSNFTHVPFKYPNSAYFQNIVKNKVVNDKILSDAEKKKIINELDVYGSYAYSDWSLQQLMEGYQKRADFDNTIFIITGDHHAFAKQFGGYFNYHVPLMIYSPMLKSSRIMKGVVLHRDITPTFISLLHNNFNIETPAEVAWLNTALDTSIIFNANTFSPLQLIDHTIGGILYKNYILCEGIVEEFTDNYPRKISDPKILQQMNRLLFLYKFLDLYAFNNDALIKNDYAYKYRLADLMINIEDTIAQDGYFAIHSGLKVVEGPKRHNSTLYFNDSHLYPVNFLTFDIPNNINEFRVEIEFKIYIKNAGDENFYVVMDLQDIAYKSETLDYDKQNMWYTYTHTLTYKKELWENSEKGALLKIYLWNPNKLEGYLDDIKLKVKGI